MWNERKTLLPFTSYSPNCEHWILYWCSHSARVVPRLLVVKICRGHRPVSRCDRRFSLSAESVGSPVAQPPLVNAVMPPQIPAFPMAPSPPTLAGTPHPSPLGILPRWVSHPLQCPLLCRVLFLLYEQWIVLCDAWDFGFSHHLSTMVKLGYIELANMHLSVRWRA